MDDVIFEIRSRLDIVEFINSYVPLKRVGRNFRALCPFHQEKTPSFIVSPERQIWRCFGACQEGGDVIKFYMKWEKLSFFEALRELAHKVGVEIKGNVGIKDTKWEEKSRILALNKVAEKFFNYILLKTFVGRKALKYLKGRGIDNKSIEMFGLGYSPLSDNSLLKYLLKKGFKKSEIIKSGLVLVKGGNLYDRFKGRIMFPLRNYRGEVLGFSGRSLEEGVDPKYINIPETIVYKKRQTVFGLDLAKEEIKKKNEVFLVEGEFDVITPFQAGIKNFVAIKGSAVTREQLILLKRFCKKIVFLLDNDEAGKEAVLRGFENARGLDIDLYTVVLDFAKDPDEAVRGNFFMFKKLISSPMVIYDFFLKEFSKGVDFNSVYSRKSFLEKLSEIFSQIDNPIIKDFYIKKVADLTNIAPALVKNILKRGKRKKKVSLLEKREEGKRIDPEKYLVGVILQSDNPFSLLEKVFNILSIDDFSTPSLQDILKYLKKIDREKFDINKFTNSLPKPLQDVVNEIYLYPAILELKDYKIEKLAYFIKIKSLKTAIKRALEKGIDTDLSNLTKEIKRVEKIYFNL